MTLMERAGCKRGCILRSRWQGSPPTHIYQHNDRPEAVLLFTHEQELEMSFEEEVARVEDWLRRCHEYEDASPRTPSPEPPAEGARVAGEGAPRE